MNPLLDLFERAVLLRELQIRALERQHELSTRFGFAPGVEVIALAPFSLLSQWDEKSAIPRPWVLSSNDSISPRLYRDRSLRRAVELFSLSRLDSVEERLRIQADSESLLCVSSQMLVRAKQSGAGAILCGHLDSSSIEADLSLWRSVSDQARGFGCTALLILASESISRLSIDLWELRSSILMHRFVPHTLDTFLQRFEAEWTSALSAPGKITVLLIQTGGLVLNRAVTDDEVEGLQDRNHLFQLESKFPADTVKDVYRDAPRLATAILNQS